MMMMGVKRKTDRRIEEIGPDDIQSAGRWIRETRMPEGLLLYQGSLIPK